ncbi:proprotein convertase subtilisin/kexin type 1 inhibitor, like [Chanos chanos]|uniref:Proprotein convertase subtilisin/kexin type 1 inhibitor, like n=1 Tax=Chanos chanos TaxID=29144 RepID=A0A6J2W9K6_CHACN|nr:uncharacterized protein LOC115821333 [Chanos chanos]
MSGPLSNAVLLLLSFALLHTQYLEAKPLSAVHGNIRSLDSTGGAVRLRRDLRDSLPYEAQMMSYPAAADLKGRANELYYQPEAWKLQGLGQALQQMVENDQRQEQEAAYLAGLLRLLSEAEANGQVRQDEEEEEDEAGDFQGPYPPDYDETDQGMSMAKPQAPWQGLLDPQLTQALLNRYRQERLLQAGLGTTTNRIPERDQDRDQEVLRLLVEKILSGLSSGNSGNPSSRRAKRDLGSVSGGRGGVTVLKRARRSLDPVQPPSPSAEASLLRVKRLGDDEDDVGENNRAPHAGLQRMKRIDTELPPPTHSRKRRAVIYDPKLIAQHILQYLPA